MEILFVIGTGLRTFATGKITTTNNIILGPADEFIPSPDIFDSDFSSVNVTIDKGLDFETPVYLYVEKGDQKTLVSRCSECFSWNWNNCWTRNNLTDVT